METITAIPSVCDGDLMQGILAAEQTAFNELYARHSVLLRKIICQVLVRAVVGAVSVTTGSELQRKGLERTKKTLAVKDAAVLRTKAALSSAKRICSSRPSVPLAHGLASSHH